ncbi:hypothetical protein SERLADRAFT_456645, partial [Serpula lacrymans var. lacrymans S7.9]
MQMACMFLLCRLHVGSLETKITPKEVRNALENLPEEVNSAYDETMDRINKLDEKLRKLALTAIMCVTYALDPLGGKQLQEAVTLSCGGQGISSDDLVDITTILGVCSGLVVVDEECSVARLIHYTAQDYFSEYKEWLCSDPQAELTNICLKTLSLPPPVPDFWGQFSGELSHYAVRNWGDHARGLVEETNGAVIRDFLHCEQNVKRLNSYDSVMHICAFWGFTQTIEYELQNGAVVDQRDDFAGCTPSHIAAIRGHLKVVSLLLDQGHDVNLQDRRGMTSLSYAADCGNEEIVKLLLARDDVNADSKDEEGRTPLSC